MIQDKNIKTARRSFLFSILMATLFLFLTLQFSLVSATSQEINFSLNSAGVNTNAKFVVQTLKYEPYPVAAGSWFNVWIKVQNIGKDDAKNAEFELIPESPFSLQNNSIKNYGLISGTINAYKQRKSGETQAQANQIILKYRVYVVPNAKEGEHTLKIKTTTDKASGIYYIYNLPIEIAKSKVGFETIFQNYNGAQSSFTITNTGEESASSIIVKLNNSQWALNKERSINLGKLNSGDSTTFSFSGSPNKKQIQLNITYNDVGGTRRSIIKNINVGYIKVSSKESQGFGYSEAIIFLIGIFLGIFLVVTSRKIHKKKRGN